MSLSINAPNRSDGDVFKKIFNDHWDEFLSLFPQYNTDQYIEPVKKMLDCGEEWGVTLSIYAPIVVRIKEQFPSVAKAVFVYPAAKNMSMTLWVL
jgi:hypothetical protein